MYGGSEAVAAGLHLSMGSLLEEHAQLVEQINPYSATYTEQLHHLMQMGMTQAQAIGLMERNISLQASMLGANDIFWISGVLFFVLIGFVWLTKRSQGGGGAEAAGAH